MRRLALSASRALVMAFSSARSSIRAARHSSLSTISGRLMAALLPPDVSLQGSDGGAGPNSSFPEGVNMREVVVVEAVRTPFGRRNGGLSTMHSLDLLGTVQRAVFDRSGIDPIEVGQVVGGCVGQVGMQSMNVTRGAWLTAGLPIEVPATTVDSQCGSSQQATGLAYALVASGVVDTALACGIELMSRVPMGSTTPK